MGTWIDRNTAARARLDAVQAATDPRLAEQQVNALIAEQHARGVTRRKYRNEEREYAPSRWAHVPLIALFEADGNAVIDRGDKLQTGHSPKHTSGSGTCVVIWPDQGRYYCNSCGENGDAATYIARREGVSYTFASDMLALVHGRTVSRDGKWKRRSA